MQHTRANERGMPFLASQVLTTLLKIGMLNTGFSLLNLSSAIVQPSLTHCSRFDPDQLYLMRATIQQHQDLLSLTTGNRLSQRESPERRRQQARGRVSFGRTTSVGSARLSLPPSSHHNNVEFARIRASNNWTDFTHPSIPPVSRRVSELATALTHDPGERASSAELSPPVAIGSGVVTSSRPSSSTESRYNPMFNTAWQDPLGTASTQGEGNPFFPSRRQSDSPRAAPFGSATAAPSSNNLYATGESTNVQPGEDGSPGPVGIRYTR